MTGSARSRRLLTVALAGAAAVATSLAVLPGSALAGDGLGGPVVISVQGSGFPGQPGADSRRMRITARPLSAPMRSAVVIVGGAALMLYPSASLDGRTLTYVRATSANTTEPSLVIVRDGVKTVIPKVSGLGQASPDGSLVWFPDVKGRVRALDVVTGAQTAACPKCPRTSNDPFLASVSPDGAYIALLSRLQADPSGAVVEIRRQSDGRRVAATPWGVGPVPSGLSWSPDSQAIAFSSGEDPTPESYNGFGIQILTVRGEVRDTAFRPAKREVALYGSPIWLDGRVWATRVSIGQEPGAMLRSVVVSAASWDARPTVAGILSKKTELGPLGLFSIITFGMPEPLRAR